MTTVLATSATQHGSREWWMFTLVACTQCGNTLIFTTNAERLAQRMARSSTVQAAAR
ncbi:MAG: hypothetical protein OZ921_07700 [Sorangiineae bacterium]|nr:hypothetical protein [Polyangiaceae bacterium]MEB2322380.1 hypothetical protein [Sorangiineae bacterium]